MGFMVIRQATKELTSSADKRYDIHPLNCPSAQP